MSHPDLLDSIKIKLIPHYLYPGQLCQPLSHLKAAIIHKVATDRAGSSRWQIMDYITLQKGSLIKYLGSGKQFRLTGDLDPSHSLFEIIDISSDKLTGTGDIVAFTPDDRKFIVPAAPTSASDAHLPTYFTAEDQK